MAERGGGGREERRWEGGELMVEGEEEEAMKQSLNYFLTSRSHCANVSPALLENCVASSETLRCVTITNP